MTRNDTARHGSAESSQSTQSQETIRPSARERIRPVPMKIRTDTERHKTVRKNSEVSPGSMVPKTPLNQRPKTPRNPNKTSDIAPWESLPSVDFGNHRRDLAYIDSSTPPKLPAISRHTPSISSPSSRNQTQQNGPPTIPPTIFGSFYNDSSEEVNQLSPRLRPGSGQTDETGFQGDDRRPSIASATTVSSNNSKSSIGRNFNRKLHGLFGEPYPSDSRQTSDSSLPAHGNHWSGGTDLASQRMRNRNNSVNNSIAHGFGSRPGSPGSSRPRTPLPSSEVTPWEYQDIRDPSTFDHPNYSSEHRSAKSAKNSNHPHHHHHRLHLPGHRRSRDDGHNVAELAPPFGLRPVTSRGNSVSSVQPHFHEGSSVSLGLGSNTNLKRRAASPTPSNSSIPNSDMSIPRSPEAHGGKRSLFDKIRRKEKGERNGADTLRGLTASSVSLQQSLRAGSIIPTSAPTSDPSAPVPRKGSEARGVSSDRDQGRPRKKSVAKKEHHRLPFISSKRWHHHDHPASKDPNDARADEVGNAALWNLDTDLSQMEGIVNLNQPPMTPPQGDIFAGWPPEDSLEPKDSGSRREPSAWDAPDSWAVKRVTDDNVGRLKELDEEGDLMREDNTGPPYCVRIFRQDSTFAVLSVALNTSVAEIIQILGKKTFLQDDLDNYHILMRKHDTSRQLEPQERPLVIQKRLLEQAGYKESDRLEDIGREDNSYLCRFTFLPAKVTGYSSLEKDPGFDKMQKFNHIDLQGRNLITIPIALYQKAPEIISLNLSHNLALDVPKDFIQACSNLRDIRYTGNEAWRLPPSLSLATRLTSLDISNNRLEQLEHADLYKLHSLVSLRLSNNKLPQLPKYFGQYRSLRSLNISSNYLTEFPDFLCDIKTLVDLDISFNSISELPKIGQLTCLERLWATNNKLAGSFHPSISELSNLREIDVRFNALDSIDILSRLPRLENLMVGHNSISAFEGTFSRIRILHMNHNPVTSFGISAPVPSLTALNLASAKLSQLPDNLFGMISGLTKLVLDKNHFVSLSPHVGKLYKLEHLSIARNNLSVLPPEIGRLGELRHLDVRENNLNQLPAEIWLARKLETLNVSSNVLESFPKPGAQLPVLPGEDLTPTQTPGLGSGPSFEELGKLESFANRRPSQASGFLSVASSPGGTPQGRKGSTASLHGPAPRKGSLITRTNTENTTMTAASRKDSNISNKMMMTFAASLRYLYLADNRLSDDVFEELAKMPELRILNISHCLIYDLPGGALRRWQHLAELYLSGNDLTALPAEAFEDVSSLKALYINGNKFLALPAELGKVQKLAILDVGSNSLKYNVCNWPYDWNWNWNRNLKYLNLSGNKRLEIKPGGMNSVTSRDGKDLTDFTSLPNLRMLGLMDVTLMVPSSIPDQTEDRRIRTAGSTVGSMAYGMADTLGRQEHLSIMDMVVPKYRSHDDETLMGMFDGQALSSGGSRIARYLYENFKHRFGAELERLRPEETAADALRRTYLSLNKELVTAATQNDLKGPDPMQHRPSISRAEFGEDDINSGCTAAVLYLKEMELYVSNVGDAQALLIHSEGGHKIITRKHDPAEAGERQRIREAGGFVSRQGKLNDVLDVSRAFGYVHMSPAVIASPHVSQITIRESDEMILLASRELWDYLTPDFAVDVARSDRGDLMRAAQKLRDCAMAFGATSKIMVMMIGVSDLRKRERARFRTHSMSMGPSGAPDELFPIRKWRKGRDAVADSKLARLDQEVEAPTGDVSLVFTDIKNSTLLWETYPIAMRSAIKMHNELMRRQLRIIGGYEVKTEGDAFMVAFPTVTSALLWSFTIQSNLLEVQWPQEILNSVSGQEVLDADGNVIFRGLSVRMGIHWGAPVCEVDPVTKRMDYFGPMVNRAARIESVADGGQITVSSDFIAEIQRLLETHIESDRSGSTGSEDTLGDDMLSHAIRRELRSLSSQGFEVKDLGERRLKGLENPEYIYLMYPHALASRLVVQQQRAEAEAAAAAAAAAASSSQPHSAAGTKAPDSQLTIIDTDNVWGLWNVSLRLEMLCSALESPESKALKPPETALLERMKNRGGEITDRFLLSFVEHQVSRVESCINTLALRNMVRPFKDGMLQQACPIAEIFAALSEQLSELQQYKAATDVDMAPS